MPDPMEQMIANALDAAGFRYVREPHNECQGLDFYLPDLDIHIEVKQFHAARIAKQMEQVPDVIAVQGIKAVAFLSTLLALGGPK